MQDRTSGEKENRRRHDKLQAEYFNRKADFFVQPIPEDIQRRTKDIVKSAGLSAGSFVLDVGTGTGALIKHFIEFGVSEKNIVGCDLCEEMLKKARQRYPSVNFWQGDIIDFPWPLPQNFADHIQCFDAVFFNACFGNIWNQKQALKRASDVLCRSGKIMISHPLGAKFVKALNDAEPKIVPHLLPSKERLLDLIDGLPLSLLSFADEPDFYLSIIERSEKG